VNWRKRPERRTCSSTIATRDRQHEVQNWWSVFCLWRV